MKSELKIKQYLDADAIAQVLQDMAASFRDKKLCLEKGSEFVVLTPTENIAMEIEAGCKKNKEKFSIELSWRTGLTETQTDGAFKISSQEPELAAPEPVDAEPAEDTDTPA